MEHYRMTFGERIKDAGYRTKRNLRKAKEWIAEDPARAVTAAAGLLTAVGICAGGCVKLINKVDQINIRNDERLRIWDPSMGVYWYSKKPLTALQKIEFERRINNGENRGEVLEDMGVLNRRK